MNETTTQILDGMNDAARAIGEWKRHSAPVSDTVLTIAEAIEGVWQLSLTVDGVEKTYRHHDSTEPDRFVLLIEDQVTVEANSDAAAAGEHAVDLLAEDFDIAVTTIVYPNGSTVVCGSDPDPRSALMEMSADELFALVRADSRLRNNNCIQDSVTRVAQARVGSQYRERMRVGLVGYIAAARQTVVC